MSINVALGHIANDRGRASEEHALRCLLSRRKLWPVWLLSARRASKDEDARGWDIIIRTEDVGTIGLQVKSSRRVAQRFRSKHPGIPCISVNGKTEAQTFLAILDALKEVRERWRSGD